MAARKKLKIKKRAEAAIEPPQEITPLEYWPVVTPPVADVGALLLGVLPPRFYSEIESLCKNALLYSGNQAGMRQAVAELIAVMRRAATDVYGHDTPDVHALSALLRRTSSGAGAPVRAPTLYPIEELHRQAHLSADQVSAAGLISRVWRAWGRHLAVAARDYGKGSGGHSSVLQDPLSSMGDELWQEWNLVYAPWYAQAKNTLAQRTKGGMVTAARLVIHVVTVPLFPGQLDVLEKLELGTTLRVLKSELTALASRMEKKES